jgi:dihydroflavonol-4-reductase
MSGLDLVTGASGFIGSHVVRALLARGRRVRCLVRSVAQARGAPTLHGLPVELVEGDLLQPESLLLAAEGAERAFHSAADYRLYAPDPRLLHKTNVEGTLALLATALQQGIRRVVHVSSVGALGLRADGRPADERTPVSRAELVGHYKRSKFDAERVAEAWNGRGGLEVVIVNPTAPIGELDVRPTPTGEMVRDAALHGMPAFVDGGLNLIDVRDAAEGIVLAAERGRPGERYILGGTNLSLREIFVRIARIAGVEPPRIRLPHWLPIAFAAVDTALARARGGVPRVPLEGARMARQAMYFDAHKAVLELGLPVNPIEPALVRAVEWFRSRAE